MINKKNTKSEFFKKTAFSVSFLALCISLTGCKNESVDHSYSSEDVSNISQKNSTPTIKNSEEIQIESDEKIIENTSEKLEKNPFSQEELAKSELKSGINKEEIVVPNNADNAEATEKTISINLSNIYVVDGDTVYGDNDKGTKVKVRMTGIDAPEITQLLGDVSKLSLQECLDQSSDIKIIVQSDNQTDKYGRTLGKVLAGNIDCNLAQVGSGMAWFYAQYADQLGGNDAVLYKQAELDAKEMRAGIWMEDMQTPWEYRRK